MSKKPESIEFNSSDRIRRAKHESNYTPILNSTIRDRQLSWKARGLHHYILSLPDTWEINVEHLSKQSDKDGADAVKSALKELQSCGYISKTQLRDDKNRFTKTVWDVYEIPQVENPQVENPSTGFPSTENPLLRINNIEIIQRENNYKEIINTPLTPQGEFVAVEVPFSDWLPENPENPEQVETPPTSQDFQEPLSLAKSSGVETISPAAAKKSKPSDADFNIFCDRWNEQKGTWAGCELSRTTETFSTKRLNGFRKAWQEHGDRLMEKFDLACEFICTNQWHRDNPFSIDTLLVTGNITKYADNAIKAKENPQVKSIKDRSYEEEYTRIKTAIEQAHAEKATKSGAVA